MLSMKQKIILLVLVSTLTAVLAGPGPEFEFDFENVEYTEGDRAQLQCYALGEAPMTYEWYDQLRNLIAANSSISIYTSVNESLLVIENVQKSDEGMYTCDAKNNHGVSSKSFYVDVKPRSGDIINVKVLNVTATSVTFEFIVEGSAEYVVVGYKEIRSDKEDRRQLNINERLNIYTIDNLVPGGKYTFRFGVLHNNGSTEWSREYEVTLLPDAPDLIIRRQEKGILELEWFRSIDDNMRRTIDKYEISYYTLSIQSGNKFIPSDCVITIQIPACRGGSSHIIAGLQARVYYQIEVRAHTAAGYGEPSKQKVYLPE